MAERDDGRPDREAATRTLAEISRLLAEMNDAVAVLSGHVQIFAQTASPALKDEIALSIEKYRRCVVELTKLLSRFSQDLQGGKRSGQP